MGRWAKKGEINYHKNSEKIKQKTKKIFLLINFSLK